MWGPGVPTLELSARPGPCGGQHLGPSSFRPQWLPEVENQSHLRGCLSLQSSHTIRLAPEAILLLTGESVKAGGTGPGGPVLQLDRRDFQGDWPGDLPEPETPVRGAG